MEDSDVMSTPIDELSANNESNISENIMKNYESLEENIPPTTQNYEQEYIPQTPKPVKKTNKGNKKVNYNTSKKSCSVSLKNNSLMCYIKPAIIVFMIILVFSYPLFDVKILKLIPKTLNHYDNITLIGLIIKALLGSLLFVISYKYI